MSGADPSSTDCAGAAGGAVASAGLVASGFAPAASAPAARAGWAPVTGLVVRAPCRRRRSLVLPRPQDRGPGTRAAGALACGQEALGGRGASAASGSGAPPPTQPRAAIGQFATPEGHATQRDVQRPQQECEQEQPRPEFRERRGQLEVVDPRIGRARISRPLVAARSVASNGSLAPSSRYSAATGDTRPTVRPRAGAPGRICVIRTA